ncbi:MAG: PAS domain-containing sensor histidine kinase [Sulfurospirillaceae bacterium]|nr:PAS domain-containing sensor histidine kinase [Sulfurospirillaceae bacterium]MDD2827161.1 PAS domain-containing sensor histidine kinase [Sulfurospirillaceae bacterium]
MPQRFNLTKRYVLALLIIAVLSALAYYNLNHLIISRADDGKTINISSRQGMLSQQIALYAIYYKTENLQNNIKLMEDSHQLLITAPMTEELKAIYFDEPILLDEKVKRYLYHAKRFYENRDGRSLTYVLQNSQHLLHDLEKATSIYVSITEANTRNLKQLELLIFILTLVTLVFEALFIFRPANNTIIKDTQEIIKQKDYSNAIIESSTNAIVTLDSHLEIKTYNKMAERIFGYEKKEMLYSLGLEKIIPEHYYAIQKDGVNSYVKKLESGHPDAVQELEAITNKGQIFPIRLSCGVSGEGEELLLIASIQDITREKLKDKIMIEQAKFAALGEMIAIIAHQWRQPLAQLNFNCMYIRKMLKDPELIAETEKNEDIIQFMSETITNFENFYKHVDNTIFNPALSINQALKLIETSLKHNHIILTQELDVPMNIYGNSNSLAQVVLSIAQNTIDIVKASTIDKPFIEIRLKQVDEMVVLTIRDNAGGIQLDPIDEIFKPFRSNKKTPSTGIGLYMSKLVIENQFHGFIEASNVENGAQFIIKLPSHSQIR